MKKPTRIVGGELQREPEWSDEEYAERLERHRADQRLGATHLLMLATSELVREMMSLPPDAEAGPEHVRHCIMIADAVVRQYEICGYWSIDAQHRRMDVKSIRLRAERTIQ